MNEGKKPGSKERWDDVQGYDMYVGRWSKLISEDFVKWLNPKQQLKWISNFNLQ